MGMYDDIIISSGLANKYLPTIMSKNIDEFLFQTKSLERLLYLYRIMDDGYVYRDVEDGHNVRRVKILGIPNKVEIHDVMEFDGNDYYVSVILSFDNDKLQGMLLKEIKLVEPGVIRI